jgi:hypothetical protein
MTDQRGNFWERVGKPAIDLLTLGVSLVGLTSIWIAIHEMRRNEQALEIKPTRT